MSEWTDYNSRRRNGWQRERERERETNRDVETDGQTERERWTCKDTDRRTERRTEKRMDSSNNNGQLLFSNQKPINIVIGRRPLIIY